MTGGWAFSNAEHLRTLSEERRDGKKDRDVAYKSILKGLVSDLKGTNKHVILRARITGACLSVHSTSFLGTVLSATEFRIFLCACYNISPVNFQSHCDRYGKTFGVTHALSCSIGGLVAARHNEIHNKLLYLS